MLKKTFYDLLSDNRIWFGKDGKSRPRLKKFLSESEGQRPWTWWDNKNYGHNQEGNKEVMSLFDNNLVFDNPKPVKLVKKILQLATEQSSNDLVLDFFCGSGTTAQATVELNKEDNGNRKFILVQLPELTEVDGNEFKATSTASKLGYKTIAEISKERIRRVINRLNHGLGGLTDDTDSEKMKMKKQSLFEEQENQRNPEISKISDNGFKVFKLSPSNFKIWRGSEITEENLVEQLEVFVDPVKPSDAGNLPSHELRQAGMLYELMLKAGYLLTDKVETKGKFFSVKDGELIIALEEMNQQIIDTIIKAQPQKVITLDNLFTGNDQLKTNTVLQMKDAGVDFKTI